MLDPRNGCDGDGVIGKMGIHTFDTVPGFWAKEQGRVVSLSDRALGAASDDEVDAYSVIPCDGFRNGLEHQRTFWVLHVMNTSLC